VRRAVGRSQVRLGLDDPCPVPAPPPPPGEPGADQIAGDTLGRPTEERATGLDETRLTKLEIEAGIGATHGLRYHAGSLSRIS
jgi:hypothetical protein